MSRRLVIGLILGLLGWGVPLPTQAGFTGDYNEYQWTLKPYGGDASVDWLGDAFLLDSGSFGTGTVSQADMVVRAAKTGTYHFTWVFFGGTLTGYKFSKLRNNTATALANRTDFAEGSGAITASAGDLIGFRITSPLGQFPAVVDISEFYAPGMEPTILVPPQPTPACLGETAIFSVIASNAATYQWQFKGQNIAEEVFEDLVLRALPPADTGNYRVIVRNPLGSVTSAAVPLSIHSPPLITNPPPTALTPCSGQTVSFSVGASGTSLRYQWLKDGHPLAGATGASLTLPGVSWTQSGEYRVSISNVCGPVLSSPVQLTVGIPPSIIGQPASQNHYSGESATFSTLLVQADGSQYQWKRNGANLPGATAPSLTLSNLQVADSGDYSVAIVNPCGNTVSSNASLTVAPEPIGIRIVRGQGRQISIEVVGPAGRNYALEVSSDTRTWTAVQTNALVISGSPLFSDTADRELRFYRVRPE